MDASASSPSSYLPGRLGFASEADVDEFVATLSRYERGEIDSDAWRAFRLVRGVYGQRQPDVQMQRIKIPQGLLTSAQLRALAHVARTYSDGRVHVTTRQNVQLYFIPLARTADLMRDLAAVGLTTREACGNSVRTITACPLAGVDPAQVFDVTPYADALTRYLLRGPRSATLPRKFKIAFEGCHRNCVQAPINDLGFVARRSPDGTSEPGFLVLSGGGTATLTRTGGVLTPFLPAAQILELAEAVVRVFHRHGERKNKHKARLKWLIQRIGFDAFRDQVEAERQVIRHEGAPTLHFDPANPPVEPEPEHGGKIEVLEQTGPPATPEFHAWRHDNVVPQLKAGHAAVYLRLHLGDLSAAQLSTLARICESHGDGTVRTTVDQNLVLRYVPIASLREVHALLQAADLARREPGWLGDVVSCPGADSCAVAVTASRGIARSLTDHLFQRRELPPGDPATLAGPAGDGLSGARIHVSGCPNGCGQHHVATIGLQGGLRKIGGKPLPVYHLTVGGGLDPREDGRPASKFGRLVGKVPARRGPQVIDRLLSLWQRERRDVGESLAAFYERVPVETVRAALVDLLEIDEKSATAADYVDLGQNAPFVVTEGEAECAM